MLAVPRIERRNVQRGWLGRPFLPRFMNLTMTLYFKSIASDIERYLISNRPICELVSWNVWGVKPGEVLVDVIMGPIKWSQIQRIGLGIIEVACTGGIYAIIIRLPVTLGTWHGI